MSFSPFSGVPNDIVIVVLAQLRSISETAHDLASCCLVSRRWNEAATPFLYGNIGLRGYNLKRFLQQLDCTKNADYIHSITVELQQWDNYALDGSFDTLLPYMTNLRSISYSDRGSRSPIRHECLARFLEALPPSVVCLEVDTGGYDVSAESQIHVCNSLRKLMPQMQHIRLRYLGCRDLFFDPATPDDPIHLPNLRSFVYSCISNAIWQLPTCQSPNGTSRDITTPELWSCVTNALQRLTMTPNAVPKDATVYAFCHSGYAPRIHSYRWPTFVRADIQARTSLAIPHRGMWMEGSIPGSMFFRMPSGKDLMARPEDVEWLAEGHLWRYCVGGMRLPAAILQDEKNSKASFARGVVEKKMKYLKTWEQWRKENPRKGNSFQGREKTAGRQLIGARTREGQDWLDLSMLCEDVPEGFKRNEGGDRLIPIGDST